MARRASRANARLSLSLGPGMLCIKLSDDSARECIRRFKMP